MVSKPINATADVVLDEAIALMCENGYSNSNIAHYRTASRAIKRLHTQAGLTDYSPGIVARYMEGERIRYERGELGYSSYFVYRRFAAIADEYYTCGKLVRGNKTNKSIRRVIGTHQKLIDEFTQEVLIHHYTPRTIKSKTSSIRMFLFFVEDCCNGDLRILTRNKISDFLTEAARKRRPSMRLLIDNTKLFIKFLILRGIVDKNILGAFDIYAPRDRKIYPGFTGEESNRILGAVDKATTLGKRDYAMLILAKHTGIRGVDIRNLKLSDIHWKAAEIRIVQSKTNKPLVLPLDIPVGNAIADYILNARPSSTDEHVFLRAVPPYVGLIDINDIVQKYAMLSGVAYETKASVGFHSFRRAMGVSLLEADVPLSIISEILGHARQNSAKRYIALDTERLGRCSMPMDSFRCERSELC